MEIDLINTIISVIGGGTLVAAFTLPSAIRKAKAEARSADLDNLQKACDGWKALADERQEENTMQRQRIADLTAQVDARYVDIGTWRDRCALQQEEITELKIYKATTEMKLCVVRNCEKRDPPSGF